MTFCVECSHRITLPAEAHAAHDDDCPNRGWCRCDSLVHASCCRECNPVSNSDGWGTRILAFVALMALVFAGVWIAFFAPLSVADPSTPVAPIPVQAGSTTPAVRYEAK